MSGKLDKARKAKAAPAKRGASKLKPADAFTEEVADLGAVLLRFLQTRGPVLDAVAEALAASIRAGRKLLVFGNGGSAAEAQHFAAELVNGLSRRDSPPVPAIALTTDTSCLTAIGNDRGQEHIFSRQIDALGNPGDVALALTTSGRSPNVIGALRSARAKGLVTIGLTGDEGGDVSHLVDFLLDVPSCSTPRIQEAHLFILHLLAARLEDAHG